MGTSNLYSKPGHLIRRAQQIASAVFLEECKPYGLTPIQYGALFAIRETRGLDATRLSEIIAFDQSTLGEVLERMDAKGWIRRVASPRDKRVKVLELTRPGRALLLAATPAVERCQRRILKPLAATDRTIFLQLLRQLVQLNNDGSRAPLRIVVER